MIFDYIKANIKGVVVFILFCLVFALVFSLSGAPLEAVLYASLICTVIGALVISVNFILFVNHIKKLRALRNSITVSLSRLPAPLSIYEKEYIELLRLLSNEKTNVENNALLNRAEMTDYYTMWVHQIKTPISAIRLMLQNGENDTEELENQIFRIEQYVDMVLQYIRCDNSYDDYSLTKFSLDDIISEQLKKYARSFIRRHIALIYHKSNIEVTSDAKWIGFVIGQILSNSLKYTNGGKIIIKLESQNPPTLSIEDTGIGIDPSDLPRIFDRGYTGFNGHANKKSTGIGLYLSKKILKRLGGDIQIESEPGKGTKVELILGQINE